MARYGGGRPAVQNVSIRAASGRTLAVVGPSGAGKTTLLRAIAGLLAPDAGDVRWDGASVTALAARDRRFALVFQDDALFPTMSVRANLRFAARTPAALERVEATARALHVADRLERRPSELSGGERQRASIARALLSDPRALLLDEPLAHLDPALRLTVRDEIAGLRRRFEGPVVYVTHDHAEAMSVADELAVLIDGRIEDCGDPARVYARPRTTRVARFLGERPMNLLAGSPVTGIRPEHVRVGGGGALRGTIARREATGADAFLTIDTPRGAIVARVPAAASGAPGDAVELDLPGEHVCSFDARSGEAIA